MSRHLALPDVDPSIALTQAVRQDFEHKFAHCPTVDQPIQRSENERAGYIAAIRGRFAALLKIGNPDLYGPDGLGLF
jgi:hypothetical protein